MKEYEVIWEIFNKCPRNQMRDVFVEEIELEDPEEYVKNRNFREKKLPMKNQFLQTAQRSLILLPQESNKDVPLQRSDPGVIMQDRLFIQKSL